MKNKICGTLPNPLNGLIKDRLLLFFVLQKKFTCSHAEKFDTVLYSSEPFKIEGNTFIVSSNYEITRYTFFEKCNKENFLFKKIEKSAMTM